MEVIEPQQMQAFQITLLEDWYSILHFIDLWYHLDYLVLLFR